MRGNAIAHVYHSVWYYEGDGLEADWFDEGLPSFVDCAALGAVSPSIVVGIIEVSEGLKVYISDPGR